MNQPRGSNRALWLALLVALVAAGVVVSDALYNPLGATDIDQVWYAARALRAGVDPYSVIGPTGPMYHWNWPFYYPVTAAVLILPLSFLPLVAARVVLAMFSSGTLAYGLSKGPRWRFLILASAPCLWAAGAGQWSMFFTGSLLLSWLAVVYPAKPNLAVACLAGQSELRNLRFIIVGWVAVVALSFALAGWWVPHWFEALRSAPHFRPYVVHWGGPLLLLAALRWRQRDARLLLAFAVVPQTTMIYETLPLLLIPKTSRECIILVTLANLASAIQLTAIRAPSAAEYIWRYGDVALWLIYFPALIMVLRRPNEGDVPAKIERAAAHLPRWLRGARSQPARMANSE